MKKWGSNEDSISSLSRKRMIVCKGLIEPSAETSFVEDV